MSCAFVTLLRSMTTVADVLVAVALDTPSTFKSADCTFGAHALAHLSPVRARFTVSTLALAATGLVVVPLVAHETSVTEDVARTPASVIVVIVFMALYAYWTDPVKSPADDTALVN